MQHNKIIITPKQYQITVTNYLHAVMKRDGIGSIKNIPQAILAEVGAELRPRMMNGLEIVATAPKAQADLEAALAAMSKLVAIGGAGKNNWGANRKQSCWGVGEPLVEERHTPVELGLDNI